MLAVLENKSYVSRKVSSLADALERLCKEEREQGWMGHVLSTTIPPSSCVNQGNENSQLWLLRSKIGTIIGKNRIKQDI